MVRQKMGALVLPTRGVANREAFKEKENKVRCDRMGGSRFVKVL
jgi:hypothetical protein